MIIFEDAEKFCTDDEAFVVVTRVQRKIEDRSGASLSVALLFFLVCAIVGSVLIAAASVSMGRMKGIEQGEQERYAVDSAMELIAEKLGKGEVEFVASTNRKDVKETIKYKKDLEDSKPHKKGEIEERYIDGCLVDFENDWKFKISGYDTSGDDLPQLRKDIAYKIFFHYINPDNSSKSTSEKLLGSFYPSADENKFRNLQAKFNNDEDSEELKNFFLGKPKTTWDSISENDFRYISTGGTDTTLKEDPFIFSFQDSEGTDDVGEKLSVNVLFCIDTQFNITAVIYPYKSGNKTNPDLLKDASIYRIVMIPCTRADIKLNPGIIETTKKDDEEEKVTTTSVQHTVTLTVQWGNPVDGDESANKPLKASVVPPKGAEGEVYYSFFPEEFRKLAQNKE